MSRRASSRSAPPRPAPSSVPVRRDRAAGAPRSPADDFEQRQRDRELVHGVLSDPSSLPAEFKSWLSGWMVQSPPILSASDAIGTFKLPACRVRHSSTQAVSTGIVTTLSFNTELYDTGAFHSTTTNTSRLTVGRPGLYRIGGHIEWVANATGQRGIYIYLNGGTYLAYNIADASAANETAISVVTEYALQVGDYVELRAYQSSGGMLNVSSNSPYGNGFWISFAADYPAS